MILNYFAAMGYSPRIQHGVSAKCGKPNGMPKLCVVEKRSERPVSGHVENHPLVGSRSPYMSVSRTDVRRVGRARTDAIRAQSGGLLGLLSDGRYQRGFQSSSTLN